MGIAAALEIPDLVGDVLDLKGQHGVSVLGAFLGRCPSPPIEC